MEAKIWLKNYDPGVPHRIEPPPITCHRLFEHPKVEIACAIGVPDPYRGETVKNPHP